MKNIDNHKLILIILSLLLTYSCNKADKITEEKILKEDTFELKRIGVDIYGPYASYEEKLISDELPIMFLKFVFQIESEQNFDFDGFNLQRNRENVLTLLKFNSTEYPLRIVAIQYGNELITHFKTENLDALEKKTEHLTSIDDLFKWMLALNFELEIAPDCSFIYKKPSNTKADFIFSDNYAIMYEYDTKSNKILKDVVSDTDKVISREYIDFD